MLPPPPPQFQTPEVCLQGPVDYTLPPPVVRPSYPNQATQEGAFWRALAEDSKATRINEKGVYEAALETANERLKSCKSALPHPFVLEVEPK